MKQILDNLIAFVFLGMAIVALIAGVVLLSYIFLYGALVGLILFVIFWFKEKFFPQNKKTSKNTGRIIEHDDHK